MASTLRFPLYFAYKQIGPHHWQIGLFSEPKGVKTFRELHDIKLADTYVRCHADLATYLKIFEDDGSCIINLIGDDWTCQAMTMPQVLNLPFEDRMITSGE